MTLTDKDIQEISVVEKAVASYFKISVGGIYDRTSRRHESIARAFVFYILHVDMGVSVGCISKIYGRKNNAIFKSLSKIKYRVDKMHMYKEMYLGICNEKKMIVNL